LIYRSKAGQNVRALANRQRIWFVKIKGGNVLGKIEKGKGPPFRCRRGKTDIGKRKAEGKKKPKKFKKSRQPLIASGGEKKDKKERMSGRRSPELHKRPGA